MTPSQAIRRMGIVAIRMDRLPDIVRLPLLKSECAWQYVGPVDPWEGEAANEDGPEPVA